MNIRLNGEDHSVEADTTIQQLVDSLDLKSLPIAVEVNRSIVSREKYADTVINDGDVIEIISYMCGG